MNPIDEFFVEYNTVMLIAIVVISVVLIIADPILGFFAFASLMIFWNIMTWKNRDKLPEKTISNGLKIGGTTAFIVFAMAMLSFLPFYMESAKNYNECRFLFKRFANESSLYANGSPDIFENLTYDDIMNNASLQEKYGWVEKYNYGWRTNLSAEEVT